MRSLADQTVEQLGGRRSILHRQKQDHVRLDAMLERLPDTSGEGREQLLHRICRLVFTHAFAEEAVLWPALRRSLDDGEELTAQVEREHQEITELVARLEQAPPGPESASLMDRSVAVLRQDVRDEEDLLLPRLQEAVDNRTLRRLGVSWEIVRKTAPTRTTHPIVSRRPPGQTLSALPLSVTDRLRDGLDYAARHMPQPAPPALVSASNLVGALARRIEQLPPLRRGERQETHRSPEVRR